ncbi:site-specific integrase [Bacteroides nordii]|uniref:site-specific integrase n=1 Tax=Bacteroides nordii TaxID=291645 RepID=UPI002490DCD9|nr:site-specific integrase [Bacteroides nordii]
MKAKRSTFKVLFYIKRTAVRVSDGKVPVMVRITIDGSVVTLSAKQFVTPALWNSDAEKVSGKSAEALEVNPQLDEISTRINNHYHRILREEDFVTAEKVRNAFLGVGVMENCILKDFETMNKEFGEMVEKGLRAKSTYNKYLTVYKHLEAFICEKKKRTDMAYKELTKDFIDDFDSYLRNGKGLSANTIWIYTMPILSLTDKAWRRGIIHTDPFSEYKLEMEETDRGYLTEEELKTIANTVFADKQTNLVRDLFVFGCFTGLSYVDVKTLTYDKIQHMDFDGEEWIITRRTKTKVSSNVPLMEISKELIERYKGLAEGNFVFPMPSNGTCNDHLKKIAEACGINKNVTYHVARHNKNCIFQAMR